HVITVGKVGTCSGHLIEGGNGEAPKVMNPPLADPTHKQYLQGETTTLTYNDAGQGWKYQNSNYMRNTFEVDDAEYAKYEAELAKKMAAMKAEKKYRALFRLHPARQHFARRLADRAVFGAAVVEQDQAGNAAD